MDLAVQPLESQVMARVFLAIWPSLPGSRSTALAPLHIRVREPGDLQPSCPRATRLPAMDEEAPVEHFYRLAMAGLARMTRRE